MKQPVTRGTTTNTRAAGGLRAEDLLMQSLGVWGRTKPRRGSKQVGPATWRKETPADVNYFKKGVLVASAARGAAQVPCLSHRHGGNHPGFRNCLPLRKTSKGLSEELLKVPPLSAIWKWASLAPSHLSPGAGLHRPLHSTKPLWRQPLFEVHHMMIRYTLQGAFDVRRLLFQPLTLPEREFRLRNKGFGHANEKSFIFSVPKKKKKGKSVRCFLKLKD